MKFGAQNDLKARVVSIQSDPVMSLVKFELTLPGKMASVITTESVKGLELKVGDEVELLVKAVHVMPVKR